MSRMIVGGAVVCGWLIWVVPVAAVGSEEQDEQKTEQKDQDDQGGADEMAAMMEAFVKLAAPGEHHAHLKPLSGQWNITGKFRMAPDAPWSESKSESVCEWILDGRFLTQRIKGEPMMGMPTPFEGFGFLGYDNMTHKHTFVWVDNFGTMTMTGEGHCADGGKVTTYMSKFLDPMTGQESHMKSVYRIEGPDRYVLEMYSPDPKGEEFLAMVLVNTRKN